MLQQIRNTRAIFGYFLIILGRVINVTANPQSVTLGVSAKNNFLVSEFKNESLIQDVLYKATKNYYNFFKWNIQVDLFQQRLQTISMPDKKAASGAWGTRNF